MNNWIRKVSVVAIIVFGLSLTGCLGSSGSSKKTNKVVPPVVQPEAPVVTPEKPVNPAQVYNPNGNKSPIVEEFSMPDLDVAAVDKGAKVLLTSKATDPEGSTVVVKYSATAGKIITEGAKSYWVAPDKAGYYEVKAIANDGTLDSDPEIITVKVNGTANGLNVAPLKVIQKKANKNIRKAISSNTSSVSKIVLQTGESVDIDLSYSSTAVCAVAPEISNGNIVIKTWDTAGPAYAHTYTYTAPATAPSGNTTTLTFNIQDQTDFTQSATVTVTFIINTAPTISNAVFTVAPTNTIAPLGGASASTKTINVTAADADTGDTLTYKFTLDPNYLPSANATLTTSGATTADLTASVYTGKGQVGVTVTDSRGGTAQYIFTFYVVDSFYGAIADKTANAALTFADVVDTDNTTVLASYVTNKTLVGGAQVTRPVATDSDTAYTVDQGLRVYYKNLPTILEDANGGTETTEAFWWTDKVGTKTLKGATAAGQNNAFAATRDTETPSYYARYPGLHTLTARVNDNSGPYVEATSTLYVNEAPDITRVSMVGADGETITLFSNNTMGITPDVSAGSSFAITATVVDADNDRVTPTANATGYFVWNAAKFNAVVPGTALGTVFANIGDDSSFATVSYTLPTSFSIAATSPTMTYTLAATTPQGERHLVIRAADGMDNVLDGTAYTITDDAATTPVTPNASGISIAADEANSAVDPETFLIAYNPEKTNYAGAYTIVCLDSAANTWKIIDEATGAYIKDSLGADIDQADMIGFLPAPYDWLRVVETGGAATNGTVGDKHYFKTNSTQIVVALNVVDGPQITGISYNKYVTAGQSTDIVVSAKGRLYQGINQKSTVTVAGAVLGTIEAGTDSVTQSEVKNKVWTYTAPATFTTGQYEDITLTVKDDANPSYKTFRTIRIYFNKAPTISSLTAGDTTKVATLDNKNYWIKKATHNISLASIASDADTGDLLGYVWDITAANAGKLSFANTASALWDPFNGATALTATGGNSGKYPVQLMVYDKDSTGVAKGATAIKSIEIGINEDPDIGRNLANTANIDGFVGTEATAAYSATLGSAWTGAGGVVDNGTAGTGLGTTTIDFNSTPQYPNVKVLGKPSGVNDEADDRNTLHYSYYVTAGTPTGPMVTTEMFGTYVPAAGDPTTAIPTKQLLWEPTAAMRKTGGDFWLHLLVTDEKPGVAKGRTEYTEKLSVTKDATAPDVSANGDLTVTLNGTVVAGAEQVIVGDKMKFSIAVSSFKDLDDVQMNIDEFIKGNSIAQTVAPLTDESRTMVSMVRNTGATTDTDPADDTFQLEYTVANGTSAVFTTIAAGGWVDATNTLNLASATGLAQGNMLYVDCNNGSRIYFKIIEGAGVANIVNGTSVLATPYDETGTSLDTTGDIIPGVGTAVPAAGANVYIVKAVDDDSAAGVVSSKRIIATDLSGNSDSTPYDYTLLVKVDNDAPVFGNEGRTNEPANENNLRFDTGTSTREVDSVVALPDNDNVFNIGDIVDFQQLVGKSLALNVSGVGTIDRDATGGVMDASSIGLSSTLALAAQGAATNKFYASSGDQTLVESASTINGSNFGTTATPAVTYYLVDDAGNKTYKTGQVLTNLNGATNEIKYLTLNNDRDAAVDSGFSGAGSVAPATFVMTGPAGMLKYLDVGDVINIEDEGATTAAKPFKRYTVNAVLTDTTATVTPLDGAAAVVDANTDRAFITKAAYTYQGFDLKRPTVSKVEIYSYDSSVTDPDTIGYLPVGTRANLDDTLDVTTVSDNDSSTNKRGDTITLSVPAVSAGAFVGITKGMTLRFTDGTDTIYVMAAETPGASDDSMDVILLSRVGANINGGAGVNDLYGTDAAAFTVVSDAIASMDDLDANTAEVMKITFEEPMYVGQDIAADDFDGNLGTTLNDVSMHVYTTDGTTSTDVSKGAAFATVTGADSAELTNLPNFAYVPSGITASSKAVLYVVFLDSGANTVNNLAKGTHFEVRFRDYVVNAATDLDGNVDALSAGGNDVLKVVADQHGNLLKGSLNDYLQSNQALGW